MRTKIISEIGYNHQGSMQKAELMMRDAKKLGLWAVKFQKWDIDGFPDEIKNIPRLPENSLGDTFYEHRKAVEFSIDQHIELKEIAEKNGLVYMCSGKDLVSIKQLVEEVGCKYIKLPSQRYKDHAIFKYLCKVKDLYKLKIFVSTGMCYDNEIPNSAWPKVADVIFHCVSLYPAKLNQCNIGIMNKYKFYNGYSSHEIGGKAIKYAIAAGAKYIERHYTFDKEAKGSDHKMSSDYKEMRRIINDIKDAEMILGDGNRNITEEELKVRKYYRGF